MPEMTGKVCLVTGATSGIGLATAHALAKAGATVITVARNAQRGAAAVAQIRQATGNPAVVFLRTDLSVQAEVRRLAEDVARRYPCVDVLINNAAAFNMRRRLRG